MDIPVGTVMSRLHRARRQLRTQLADLAEERGFGRDNAEKMVVVIDTGCGSGIGRAVTEAFAAAYAG